MTTEIRIVLQNYINLAGEELENAVSLIDALDDLNDVLSVFSNFDTAE